MQVYIVIDVSANERKAAVGVNPAGMYTNTMPSGGSVEEAAATHSVLGEAITFAKMINAQDQF